MQTLHRTFLKTIALTLALFLCRASFLRAEDAAPKPVLAQYGFAAGKSIDALTAFATQAGIPLPPNFSADALEQQFPFIGKGGLATDQPIGIAFVGGPDVKSPDQGIVFVFPVKPTAATLDSLKTQGGTAVADHPDTLLIGGTGFRRTADYLIFSPTPAAVAVVETAALTDAVKDGDALAKLSLDLKSVRQNMPDQYKQTLDMATGGAPKEVAASLAPMLKTLDTVDRVSVSLGSGEKGVRLVFTTTPYKLPAVTAANLPGMPAGVLARLDLGVSFADAFPQQKDLFATLGKSASDSAKTKDGKPLTDDQKKKVESIMTRVTTLFTEPVATSVGVEMIAGEPVVYIVHHLAKPTDVAKEIQETVRDFNALQKETGDSSTIDLQTYQSDGVRVLRLVGNDSGKPAGYVDIVQKDNDVFLAGSSNAYRYVHHLIAAKDEGPITAVTSAWLDLGKLAFQLGNGPNAPLAGLPADTRKQLVDLLDGQKLSIATSSEGDSASAEISVTKGLLQNTPKLLALFGMGGAPAAAPAPGAAPDAPPAPKPQ